MSDRAPKVTVTRLESGQWFANCQEPGCPWTYGPDASSTYMKQRAAGHRRDHRERVCEHCDRSDHCEDCGGCLAPCCSAEDCPPRCSCGEDRM